MIHGDIFFDKQGFCSQSQPTFYMVCHREQETKWPDLGLGFVCVASSHFEDSAPYPWKWNDGRGLGDHILYENELRNMVYVGNVFTFIKEKLKL